MDIAAILDRSSSSEFTSYSPTSVIDAVNALLTLGKDGALAAMEAYLARADEFADPRHGLFLVMRVLFEVPAQPGYHPPVRIGGSVPPPPADPTTLPMFPIALIDDIPLMLVSGFMLGGEPEPLAAHIAHFRARGTLRRQPLHPVQPSRDVLAGYEQAYQKAYGAPPSAREVAFVQGQLDRM
jgi:hypothetical protein